MPNERAIDVDAVAVGRRDLELRAVPGDSAMNRGNVRVVDANVVGRMSTDADRLATGNPQGLSGQRPVVNFEIQHRGGFIHRQ